MNGRQKRHWLIAIRKSQGYTQHTFSAIAGFHIVTYARYELGGNITAKSARHIGYLLDFDWRKFFPEKYPEVDTD